MELRPGYKQTELGVLPEDWKVVPLSSVCSMKSGETITSSYISSNGSYPCYGGNGLRGYTARFTHEGSFCLIGRQGALCGNVFEVNGRFFASEHAVVVTANPEIFIPWLTYVLRDMNLNQYSESSAQPGLSVAKLALLPIACPPLAEQKAIANALSDVDALLDSLGALIAKKRDMKKAAMQELLTGKTRLPGFGVDKGYVQTEVGVIPNDWAVKPLDDLFDFSNGFNAGSESYGKGIPFISTLDVLNFSHLRCENIIGKVLLEKGQETYLVKKGDILFTRTSETQEEVGLTSVYMDEKPVTFGGFIIRGRQKKSCFDECYLGFAFKNSLVRKQIISLGQGGIHVNIGQTELQKVYIPIPPISEQKAIATALSDMDAELEALEARYAKVRDMKTGMMQELLTGKTRLIPAGE